REVGQRYRKLLKGALQSVSAAVAIFRPNLKCRTTRQLLRSQRQLLGRLNIPSRKASTRMEARRPWGQRNPIPAKPPPSVHRARLSSLELSRAALSKRMQGGSTKAQDTTWSAFAECYGDIDRPHADRV